MDTSPHKSDFVTVNGVRLHYLDWGGSGPVLLFLAGLGCNAYIFDKFAPRFADKFHVLALTRRWHGDSDYPETGCDPDTLTEDVRRFLDALKIDQVILVGHSMARVELSRFAALYPQRLIKLVFLDAAYDTACLEDKAAREKNPLRKMIPAWPEDGPDSIEECVATVKRLYPALAAVWGEVLDEHILHEVQINSDGKVVDKMSDAISTAFNDMLASFEPGYSNIQAPVLSFFAIPDGYDHLSSDYMTEEQKAQVLAYFKTVLGPYLRQYIEKFQQNVPHAKIVEIPNGHHYCFMKQEKLVFNEMRMFLLEGYRRS
jgi:non-heme chloroperoxidase